MRTIFRVLLFLFLAVGIFRPAKACFEVIPKIHSATCYYDSTHFVNFAVRVGSLRLAANPAGTWCTFALHNNGPILDLIDYIAVVDSGTTHRLAEFGSWQRNLGACSTWDSVNNIGWDAFLNQLMGATTAGTPVELIIRCHFTPGYAIGPLMGDLPLVIMGWANWNDTLNFPSVVNRWWLDWPGDSFVYVPIHKPSPFFNELDADLMYVGVDDAVSAVELSMYPNPAHDVLHLQMTKPNCSLRSLAVYDVMGRQIIQVGNAGSQRFSLDVSTLPNGLYFAEVVTTKGVITKQFLID